jgi:hypothetical protein
MAGLTKEQRAARAAEAAAAKASAELEEKPVEGCVFMYRDDKRAEVNENSIEIMEGLGWVQAE